MNSQRLKLVVRGAVQGVGFRPFVYRLATELELKGWVLNSSQGVFIEVEGPPQQVAEFAGRLKSEKPPRAIIQSCEPTYLDGCGYSAFEIRESRDTGEKNALILPDIATCADCLRELLSPNDRRFRYPFTNCTNCGPRFSIIDALPYDRANTSMRKFAMCADCAREYHDPSNRRFHAEPIACARCGPQLELWDSVGRTIVHSDAALLQATAEVRAGKIVALKGLGGFQLLTDARNGEAIRRLRIRKHREEKPFAVMYPSLEAIAADCLLEERHPACFDGQASSLLGNGCDGLEARRPSQAGSLTSVAAQILLSSESPIVLLPRRTGTDSPLAANVAPNNPNLGVMLPYTPLHHLLLHALNFPVIATSGNLSDEPICINEREALERLRGLADFFLVHDRPIVRHVDDSIVRIVAGREMILRRARGYAPLPISLNRSLPSILAVGAHLKNTVALSVDRTVFISQHLGDLATKPAHDAFRRSLADLPRLYATEPRVIAHDLHPDYLSTKAALELPGDHLGVQHHWAHIAACMAENELEPPLLGIAWDGTGYGTDATIWGGEFFLVETDRSRRVAHFRHFRLPGGEAAVREPRRSALGLLHEIFGENRWPETDLRDQFDPIEWKTLRRLLVRQLHSPVTSSVGRLFDAIAALGGLRFRSTFEGQAAMELEFACESASAEGYPFFLRKTTPLQIDWEPTIRALLADRERNVPVGLIASRFHRMLVNAILEISRRFKQPKIVLSGGCFQNRYLSERTIEQLRVEGFQPYWHQRIPPNDGGIALGQVWAASALPKLQ